MDTLNLRQRILLNQPHIESIKDDLVNFNTNMKAPLKECKVYFEPVQEGSGDPSPDNVRNITGWNGVNVYQSGKNLCDNNKIKKGYFVSAIDRDNTYVMGHEVSYNSSVSVSDYIKVEENSQYTCSFQYAPYSAMGFIFFSEKNEESAISSLVFETDIRRSPYTFIVPLNCKYIRINTINLKNEPQILLELGDTATIYEPYQGTTTSVNWTDEVGTVYGGYVDLVKGELVATHVIEEPNENTWNLSNRYVYQWGHAKCYSDYGYTHKQLCTHWKNNEYANESFAIINKSGAMVLGENFWVSAGFAIEDITKENVASWLQEQKDNGTPVQIIGELMMPIHYQLTPQQLLTLKGTNNIWSDTNGQTEVKFWTH